MSRRSGSLCSLNKVTETCVWNLMDYSLSIGGIVGKRSERIVLIHAAHGESQYKLQSVRNALHATQFVASVLEGPTIIKGGDGWFVVLMNKGLVQFAYGVNTFSDQHKNVSSATNGFQRVQPTP